jgi:hypothetical protein
MVIVLNSEIDEKRKLHLQTLKNTIWGVAALFDFQNNENFENPQPSHQAKGKNVSDS